MCCGSANSQPKQYQTTQSVAQPAKAVVVPFNNSNKGFQANPFITPLAVKQALIIQQQIAHLPKKGVANG